MKNINQNKKINSEVVFGAHPIIELLKAKKRKLYTIYTTNPKPKVWSKIVNILPKYTNIISVTKNKLDSLSDNQEHQNLVGLASPFVIRKKFFSPSIHKFVLLLDNIQDTRNLGAILRSAYCTGVTGVILTTKNSAPITAATIKASAGLIEYLEVYQTNTAASAINLLKENKYNIFLATVDNSKSATSIKYELPICLVIGNEATGISKNILKSGQHITIPQVQSNVSYNASVAAGILLCLMSTETKLIT